MYQPLVEYIVKSLVDNPDQVKVSEIEKKSEIILEISVADTDMGRVIGKSGRVINSIRTLVQASVAGDRKRISIEII